RLPFGCPLDFHSHLCLRLFAGFPERCHGGQGFRVYTRDQVGLVRAVFFPKLADLNLRDTLNHLPDCIVPIAKCQSPVALPVGIRAKEPFVALAPSLIDAAGRQPQKGMAGTDSDPAIRRLLPLASLSAARRSLFVWTWRLLARLRLRTRLA